MLPLDTTEEAYAVQIDVLRRLGPERRLAIAFELSALANRLCETGIRTRHPGYNEREVALARIRLSIGDDLFRAAYPGAALLEP